MRRRLASLTLAGCLLLSSCASMLNRSYSSVSLHVDKPTTAGDSSVLRVANYRELVSAVLYLVSQGAETGDIQLYDYSGEVANDLSAACAEVATQDPLAAYAVDYIRHEYVKVVSSYEARLYLHYRRSMEQVRSMVNVTGTSAIRNELQKALRDFSTEVVLRVGYFAQDVASIAELIRETYYDSPATALGIPEAEINLYPETGRERVVEILLTYPERDLRTDSEALARMAEEIAREYGSLTDEEAAQRAAQALAERVRYDPDGPSNACDALREGRANSEGMALTYALLWSETGKEPGRHCQVMEGTWNDPGGNEWPRFWDRLTLSDGRVLYFDPASETVAFETEDGFFALGYRWNDGSEKTPLQVENP